MIRLLFIYLITIVSQIEIPVVNFKIVTCDGSVQSFGSEKREKFEDSSYKEQQKLQDKDYIEHVSTNEEENQEEVITQDPGASRLVTDSSEGSQDQSGSDPLPKATPEKDDKDILTSEGIKNAEVSPLSKNEDVDEDSYVMVDTEKDVIKQKGYKKYSKTFDHAELCMLISLGAMGIALDVYLSCISRGYFLSSLCVKAGLFCWGTSLWCSDKIDLLKVFQ